jgi:hypothetical protein
LTDTLTLVSEGQRRVTGIALPKNPDSPSRKVSFETQGHEKFNPAGWIYAEALGDIKIGDFVSYKIEKTADGFNKLTHIAPVDHNQRDQTAGSAEAPKGSRDDAQAGAEPRNLDSPAPAERDVANSDTQRFEGWAFVANVGMVDLAYEELSDALESGELDSITPAMLKTVALELLNAADQAQRALVGRTDRGAQSHTRARGVVRTALRKHPVRGGLPDLTVWSAELTKTTTRLLQMAATL